MSSTIISQPLKKSKTQKQDKPHTGIGPAEQFGKYPIYIAGEFVEFSYANSEIDAWKDLERVRTEMAMGTSWSG